MCGITGFCDLKNDISKRTEILHDMMDTLARRGPDEENSYVSEHVLLGHRRLTVIDAVRWKTAIY